MELKTIEYYGDKDDRSKFKKVRGKVKTKAELIEMIQARTDGSDPENPVIQPFSKITGQGVDGGDNIWAYVLTYGNQVIKTFQVEPHTLDDEGNLQISAEDEAMFRKAVKAAIPTYSRQIWKQKVAFAIRNRENAKKRNLLNLPVAVEVA
jgi:hypothetical protein